MAVVVFVCAILGAIGSLAVWSMDMDDGVGDGFFAIGWFSPAAG